MSIEGAPVEARNLTRRFGSSVAVDEVSFVLEPGMVVGLLGPNGAGKTTTMRLLTGYLRPDSGSVLLDGVDLATDAVARKQLLGYVPESAALYPELTVVGTLRYWAKLRRVPRARRAEAIDRAIDAVNLGSVGRTRVGTLSQGFRQRVAIAQALVHDPRVVVLDEPTNGLDPRQVAETRELIATLGRTRTVLLSSHLLSEVQAMCRRVVVLDQGKVVADAEVAGLMMPTGQGRLEVRVGGNPDAAARVVRAVSGITSVRVQGPVLIVDGTGADLGQRVSRAIVGAGIGLEELRDVAASTLEDAYLRLVQG